MSAEGYCPKCGAYMPLTLDEKRRVHECHRTPPISGLPHGICACPACGGYAPTRAGCWGTADDPHPHVFMQPIHELVARLEAAETKNDLLPDIQYDLDQAEARVQELEAALAEEIERAIGNGRLAKQFHSRLEAAEALIDSGESRADVEQRLDEEIVAHAQTEARVQELEAALRGLKLITGCWCPNSGRHDLGCKAARAALAGKEETP